MHNYVRVDPIWVFMDGPQREFETSASVRPAARPESACSQAPQLPQPRPPPLYPPLYPSLSSELRADEMPESRFSLGDGQPVSHSSTELAESASTSLQLEHLVHPAEQPQRQPQPQMQTQTQTQTLGDSLVGALGEPTRAAASKATCSDFSMSDPPSLVEQVSVCNADCDEATDASRWFDDTSFHYRGPVLRIQFKKLDPSLALVCHSTVQFGFCLQFLLVHHLHNYLLVVGLHHVRVFVHIIETTYCLCINTPLSI